MSIILQKEWDDYETVQRALKIMRNRSNSKQIPLSTLISLKTWLCRFSEYSKMNPDELIAEGLKDSEKSEDRINDFFVKTTNHEITWSTHKITFNSAAGGIYGSLRGFYTKNNVNTVNWSSPRKQPSKVDNTDGNYPMFTRQEGDNLDLNRDLLVKLLKTLKPRDEIIGMCLMTSGVDVSDILRLNMEDVNHQQLDRIFISFVRQKTGESGKTFFSKETSQKLRKFIDEERKDAKDADPLFVTKTNRRLSSIQLAMTFKRAQKRIGIPVRSFEHSPLRAKRLRKLFKSAGTRAGLEDDIIRVFMGHSGQDSKTYLGKSREELEYYYEKLEPFVTMNRIVTKPFEEKLKRVEKENQRLRGLLDDQNTANSLLGKILQNPDLLNQLNNAIEKELQED